MLIVEALTSGAVGLMMVVAAEPLSDLWGLPVLLIRNAGIPMVLWGVGLLYLVRRETVPVGGVRGVIVANWVWVAASIVLLIADWTEPTAFGFGFVMSQATIVLVFAILQHRFLRLHRVG